MSDPNQEFQPPPPPPLETEPERQRPTYLMWTGIALVVVGIIVIVLGIPGIGLITGGPGTGAAVCALGILFFAFSFMRMPAVPPDAPPPVSLGKRLVAAALFVPGIALLITGVAFIGRGLGDPNTGRVALGAAILAAGLVLTGWGLFRSFDAKVFLEPTELFRSLRIRPHWLLVVLIAGIMNGAYTTAFVQRLTPERIINFTVTKLEESPFKPPPEVLERMRTEGVVQQKAVTQQAGNFVKAIVTAYFGVAFVAALALLGVLVFGGRMHYWQAYAAIAYVTFAITLIQKGISFVILYLKSPDDIHPILNQESLVYDNLGLLVSGGEHPVLFVIASAIGVLSFYRLWLVAKGLREAGYKVSSSAGWGTAIVIFALFLLFGIVIAALFGSFFG